MSAEARRAQYEQRAREADDLAAKAKDYVIREQWLKIAGAYRQPSKSP
jgi:hypothetical protein